MADDREEEQEFINSAHRMTLDTLNQLNYLLDVAELVRPKADIYLKREAIKLAELLTEVEDSLRTQAHEKQLNLQLIKTETQSEIIVYGDSYRLRQVLLTLIGDAITHTDEGGITIVVEMNEHKVVLQSQEHPGLIKVHVADNRNMYSQDWLLRFLRQTNDNSSLQWYHTPVYGLAISKKRIEAMNGELHLALKGDGRGATVTISLPLYQEPVMRS